MIKYALICECSSKFEGWFPTNEGYENQLAQGQVVCPMCDSTKVRKDIMAPNVKKKRTQIKIKSPRQRGKEAMLDMTGGQMVLGGRARILIKKIETHVKENFENVGKGFAREARKAQVGDRNEEFYGTATKKEADELLNEGIDLFHVPEIKDN
jgi:hypothetical protein